MANLIESLLATSVAREDDKRLEVSRRPPPNRPRELFDMFAAMGFTASIEGLMRGIEFRLASPGDLAFAVLSRWPTTQELAAHGDKYKAILHLRRLLATREFRQNMAARLMIAYPEKQRLLFIRLPRCAGATVMQALELHHPVLSLDLEEEQFRDPAVLVPVLGRCLRKFEITRTVVVTLGSMAPFVRPGGEVASAPHWHNAEPPCRPMDLLFTVLRPPRDLALSEVNALLTELRTDPPVSSLPASLRDKIGKLPARNDGAGWRAVGRTLLGDVVSINPVCRALGDGTAADAIATCARVPVQLVGMSRYGEWARVALGPMDEPKRIGSDPILGRDDLTAREDAILAKCIGEDEIFYARFAAKFNASELPSVKGEDL